MADKDLKSLTIGGTTFRNTFTDPDVGKTWSVNETVSVPAGTWARGAKVTLADAGDYLILPHASFYSTTSTGATERTVQDLVVFNGGVERGGVSTDVHMATNQPTQIHSAHILNLTESQVPCDIYVNAWSSKACTAALTSYIAKLASYPGIVGGGVIRTLKSLKNSICYRPLNFGKAVA